MQKKKLNKKNKNSNKSDFFHLNTKISFTKLKQAFIIAFIFCYFYLKCHI